MGGALAEMGLRLGEISTRVSPGPSAAPGPTPIQPFFDPTGATSDYADPPMVPARKLQPSKEKVLRVAEEVWRQAYPAIRLEKAQPENNTEDEGKTFPKIRIALSCDAYIANFAKSTNSIPYTQWMTIPSIAKKYENYSQEDMNKNVNNIFNTALLDLAEDPNVEFVFNKTYWNMKDGKDYRIDYASALYGELRNTITYGEYRLSLEIPWFHGKVKYFERIKENDFKISRPD